LILKLGAAFSEVPSEARDPYSYEKEWDETREGLIAETRNLDLFSDCCRWQLGRE
jgi:hypothetical protein